jgi:phosphoribosylamine--glycine ligase
MVGGIALCQVSDGTTILAMQPAQDFKAGLWRRSSSNTGGGRLFHFPLPWAPNRYRGADPDWEIAPTHDYPEMSASTRDQHVERMRVWP